MKVLLLCDDLWHPGEAVRFGLDFLVEQGHSITTVMDAKDIVTPELLRAHDAVIIAKGNALNGANAQAPWFEDGITYVDPKGYQRYVEEGGAMLVLHAGVTAHGCQAMTDFLGVKFVTHPPQCPVEFRVTDPESPIMDGVEAFTLPQDEHYQIEVLSDRLHIFAETVSNGRSYPAGLSRDYGNGRLCILTPGHNAFTISYPPFRKVICNALRWVTKQVG